MISKRRFIIFASPLLVFLLSFSLINQTFAWTATNNYDTTTTFNPCVSGCDLWVEKFSGLQEGATIKNILFNVTTQAGSASLGIYDANGYYNSGSAGGADYSSLEAFNNTLYLEKVTTLPSTTLNVTSLVFYDEASAVGDHNTIHVRMKLYLDGSGAPTTLLGETASTLVPYTTGDVSIPVSTTLVTGATVWVALETDAGSADDIFDGQACPCPVPTDSYPHIYGPGPPDLINAVGLGPASKGPTIGIDYNYDGGFAGKLLGHTGSIAINSTGLQTFPVNGSIIVPGDSAGKIWIGYDLDSSGARLLGGGTGSNQAAAEGGLNGPFPNPYGSTPEGPATNETIAAWMELNGQAISLNVTSGLVGTSVNVSGNGFADNSDLTLLFDTSHLAMAPSSPSTDSSGSFTSLAFTVPSNATVGSHTVKIIDASNNQAIANFTVTPTLNIQVGNVTSGQFTQTYKTSAGT